MSDLLPRPEPPPISAREALRLVDIIIQLCGLYDGRRSKIASVMQTYSIWLQQTRPHLVEAAARSNDIE